MKPNPRLSPDQQERLLVEDAPSVFHTRLYRRIDSAIDEAIKSGEWDHLPGKGKPLELLTLTPDEQAHKLLKDAGFVPDWIALRQQIEIIESELTEKGRVACDADAVHAIEQRCDELNAMIRQHNRLVPSPVLQRGLKDARAYLPS
jgi:enterochelin esterase family protein